MRVARGYTSFISVLHAVAVRNRSGFRMPGAAGVTVAQYIEDRARRTTYRNLAGSIDL